MAVLVVAEHDNAALRGSTLNTIGAASKIGGDVTVLVAGSGCRAVAEAAAAVEGVSRVLLADDPSLENPLAENLAALVLSVAKDYTHVLAPATTFGKNFMPRVAAKLDVAQISDINGIESADTFTRPFYAGNAIATVQSSDPIKVITVRVTAFDAARSEEHTSELQSRENLVCR